MGIIGALWGIGGVLALLSMAVIKITPATIDAFSYQFQWYHWVVLVLNTSVVVYFKGYRALHKKLMPRVAARAKEINENPSLFRVLLAPLYTMGYFQIERKTQMITIGMTIFMVVMIILVRLLTQPFRGIIDLAIVTGLSWGMISLLYHSMQAFSLTAAAQSSQT